MGKAESFSEIVVTVPKGAEESTIDQLLAHGYKDLRHGERRFIPIAFYALQWPGKEINEHTTFKTIELAESYVSHCGDEKPAIVPMCVHANYREAAAE